MDSPVARRLRHHAARLLGATAVWLCLVEIGALARAWHEVHRNGYLQQGFVHDASTLVADRLLEAAPIAAALLALDLLARGVFALGRRPGRRRRVAMAVPITLVLGITYYRLTLGGIGWHLRFAVLVGFLAAWLLLLRHRESLEERFAGRVALRAGHLIPLLACVTCVTPMFGYLPWTNEPWQYGAVGAVLVLLALVERGPLKAATLQWSAGVAALVLVGSAGYLRIVPWPPTLKAANPVNVLFIGIDTLRADAVQMRRIPTRRDLTPHIRRAMKGAFYFDNAYSQSSWTMPAFASMMTGLYPREHRATSMDAFLDDSHRTLAEIIAEAGYDTASLVSHFFIDRQHGFGQGFHTVNEDHVLGHGSVTSAGITRDAIAWIDTHPDAPFLLFAHYFDPHYDYRDHPDIHFADRYRGPLRRMLYSMLDLALLRHRFAPQDIRHLRNLYDEEVAYTDEHVGRLIDHVLQQRPNTLVVLVADHGEEFMEHGWIGHTSTLHDEIVHVPLAIRLPKAEGKTRTIDHIVETRAVFGTVLEYLGLPNPEPEKRPSLMPYLRGKPTGTGSAFSEVRLLDAPLGSGKRVHLSSIRTPEWKLIHDHVAQESELYSVTDDPGEHANVFADHGEIGRQLRDQLLPLRARPHEVAPTREVSPEVREQLRALGYAN